jgi:hypothetical protein
MWCAQDFVSGGHQHPNTFLLQKQLSAEKTRTKCLERFFMLHKIRLMNQDSVVCTVTCYRLDSPGTESRRGRRDFPHHSGLALGSNQPPVWGVPSLSPGGTAAEVWRWPPTPSSAEVKERVELYLYSLSLPWWSVLRPALPLTLQYSRVIPFNVRSVPVH